MSDHANNATSYTDYGLAGRPCRKTTLDGETHTHSGKLTYNDYELPNSFTEYVGENREKHTTAFSYDAENRPVTMIYDGGDAGQTTTAYDGFGRMSGRTVKAGASGSVYDTSYTYESGDSDDATTPLIKTIEQDGLCFVYEYDDVGNIESVTQCTQLTDDHEPVAPYSTTQYVYDRIGQLIRVNDPQDLTAGNSGTTWVYTYNLGGNILSKNAYAYTTGDVGTAVESHSYAYGNANWRDQLTAFDGQPITYDAIGNPLNDGTWKYEWRHGRQLASMQHGIEADADYKRLDFTYNADGLRTRKVYTYRNADGVLTSITTRYVLHGKNIVHMTYGDDEMHFWYDAQNRPAIVDFNGVKYGYVYNLQGDVMALVDASGTRVVNYVYDAWGKQLGAPSGTMAATLGTLNPFRYRGYVFDEDIMQYWTLHRIYNPNTGRFINADPHWHSNLYSYCSNNPTIYSDPNGTTKISADGAPLWNRPNTRNAYTLKLSKGMHVSILFDYQYGEMISGSSLWLYVHIDDLDVDGYIHSSYIDFEDDVILEIDDNDAADIIRDAPKARYHLGDTGIVVYSIQKILFKFGLLNDKKQIDGVYGQDTMEAVKAFKRWYNNEREEYDSIPDITVNGIWGK